MEILGALLKNASYLKDCDFVMEVMKILKEEDIKPSEKFLKQLDTFYRIATDMLRRQVRLIDPFIYLS